ncbi:hypothetical protein Tco_0003599 [Tanacetum coccineum]
MGSLLNTSERIFSTFDGVCHQTFRAARFDIPRTAESDTYYEEEYVIKRNKFGEPIYGRRPAPYINCVNQEDRSSAIQAVTNLFRKISVWKKAVSFLGSLPVPLILQEHTTEKPDRHDPNAQEMKPGRVIASTSSPRVFTMGRIREGKLLRSLDRAFNINEPIYAELCHEFYSTYEFDEVCADDELQSKKIIKFRLGGRAHSLTLLEFARRLGLYQAVELEEDGFNVYFEGGLRSDDNFNATNY